MPTEADAVTDAVAEGAAATSCRRRRRRRERRSRRVRRPIPTTTGATIGFVVHLAIMTLTYIMSSSHPRNGELRSLGHVAVVDAIRANPNPIVEYDGSGNKTNDDGAIYIRGDERLHWYEDEDGYTLIEDINDDQGGRGGNATKTAARGATLGNNMTPCTVGRCASRRWVYAEKDSNTGDLISTGLRFGSPSYREAVRRMGLKKHVRPNVGGTTSSATRDHFGANSVRGGTTPWNDDRPRVRRGQRRRRGSSTSESDPTPTSLRNLVVLIRFSDHANRTLPSPSDYNVLMNGPGGRGTVAPTGSVRDVFASNSYGKFVLESTVYPWITLSETESYYSDGKSGLSYTLFEGIREALDVIQSDPDFDLSRFNSDRDNGDDYIDAITIVHSGYGAEFGGTDCHGAHETDRIWSHKYFMYTGDWKSADGTVVVRYYNINPGLWGTCGSEISRIGVIAHETAHFLGLPDLYDPDGAEGIGMYCLMADSWGIDGSQRYPPMMSPWSKIQLGWLVPTMLKVRGDYPLRRSWEHPDAYKIQLGSTSEYLLIENRQPGSFDVHIPLGGLAIWHIDDGMFDYANSLEGYPGQYGWPGNGKHYQVALLQADGKYDLERGWNRGDYADLFRYDHYFGVDHLSPSASDPKLGPFPNTDSYRFGGLGRTNHFITGVSVTGPSMTFSFLPSSPCQPNEVHFELTLLTDGKGNEVSWSIVNSNTYSIALSGSGYGNYMKNTVEQCLPATCYTFVIDDAGDDGLCCSSGTGGYSIRLNGLKVASGNSYGSKDVRDLLCMGGATRGPTSKPTPKPSTTRPTAQPSTTPNSAPVEPFAMPSPAPTFMPSLTCETGKGLFEISTDEEKFLNEISWDIQDMLGNTVISNTGALSGFGPSSVRECVDLNSCYTFSIRNSFQDAPSHSSRYNVKLDGEIIAYSDDSFNERSTTFGGLCIENGDTACTSSNASYPMSMFRLELAADSGENITWKLVNGTKNEIHFAGPYGNCEVNTVAICLPREDCFEFTISDNSNDGTDKGLFTVMFSHGNNMVQNQTGPISGVQRVFLGTCYGMELDQ